MLHLLDFGFLQASYIAIIHYGKKREIDNFKICSYLFFLRKIIIKFYLPNNIFTQNSFCSNCHSNFSRKVVVYISFYTFFPMVITIYILLAKTENYWYQIFEHYHQTLTRDASQCWSPYVHFFKPIKGKSLETIKKSQRRPAFDASTLLSNKHYVLFLGLCWQHALLPFS
jgi:hypothetical protein